MEEDDIIIFNNNYNIKNNYNYPSSENKKYRENQNKRNKFNDLKQKMALIYHDIENLKHFREHSVHSPGIKTSKSYSKKSKNYSIENINLNNNENFQHYKNNNNLDEFHMNNNIKTNQINNYIFSPKFSSNQISSQKKTYKNFKSQPKNIKREIKSNNNFIHDYYNQENDINT